MARTRKSNPATVEDAGLAKRTARKPAPVPQPAVEEPPAAPPPQPHTLLQELRETKQSLLALQSEWREKLENQLGRSKSEVDELRRDLSTLTRRVDALSSEVQNLSALTSRVDTLSSEVQMLKDRSEEKSKAEEEVPYDELVKEPAKEPGAATTDAPSSEGGWLGITVESAIVIADVLTGSPAASAGLLEGDIITRVNGTPILEASALRALVEETAVGEEFVLDVVREGKTQKVRVHFEPIAPAGSV